MRLLPAVATLFLFLPTLPVVAQAPSSDEVALNPNSLDVAFEKARVAFWKAETPPIGATLSAPESLRSSNVALHRHAAKLADDFLKLLPPPEPRRVEIVDSVVQNVYKQKPSVKKETEASKVGVEPAIRDHRLSTALYYSAISHSWLEEHGLALASLDRLLEEFPNYVRPQFPGFPEYKRPARFDLLQLKIYHLSRLSPLQKVPDYVAPYLRADCALATLYIGSDAAFDSVKERQDWLKFVKQDADTQRLRDQVENILFTPDARRAALVPSVQSSLAVLHSDLVPTAIQVEGGLAVSEHLRRFSLQRLEDTPYISFLGLFKRPEIRESAQKVSLAFKAEGDSRFNLNNGLPQLESLFLYRQMLEFAQEPSLKGYAQFRIADCLGTMGRYTLGIQSLEQAIDTWHAMTPQERPPMPANIRAPNEVHGPHHRYYIEEAYYYRNFYYGAGLKEREKGIALQKEFVKMFPESKWAPEAMFDQFLWNRWNGDKDLYLRTRDAIDAAHALSKRFPYHIRARVAMGMMTLDEYKNFKRDPVKDALEIGGEGAVFSAPKTSQPSP